MLQLENSRELPVELIDFARQLNSEVHDRIATGSESNPFSESVYTDIVLEYLGEIGMVDDPHVCHHEGRVRNATVRISGYSFGEEDDRLDLFVTVFKDQPEPTAVPKEELLEAAQQAARFYKAITKAKYAKDIDPSSEAQQLANLIDERQKDLRAVRVFVITDGVIKEKKFKSIDDGGVSISLEVMDIERLYRGMQAGLPRDEVLVDFEKLTGQILPCVFVPSGDSYSTCLAVIPGNVLDAVYEQYGARLLESNVRSFLSVSGKINKGIRETLKGAPEMFLAYNNGVVMTADALVLDRLPDGGPGIKYIRGMQIVNGGQTTASIHRARKADKADLSKVYVPAKIIYVKDKQHVGEMVGHISKYANSQNTIQPADFSANEPFHIQIEKLADTIWCPDQQGRWFYERARGSYQVALFRDGTTPAKLKKLKEIIPPQRRFSKPELAKFAHAWEQKPHLVGLGAQKNFDAFMQGIRDEKGKDWLPDDSWYKQLVSKAIVFRDAQKVVRGQKFTAQPANIVAYLVSLLALRAGKSFDLSHVWARQTISPELQRLLATWAAQVDKGLLAIAAGRMVSEVSKKEQCWLSMQKTQLEKPTEMIPEWSGAHT